MMTALLKPSQDMKAALAGLGVESGDAAVATWGLFGTFQKLQALAKNNPSAMAVLLPNIRGFAGAERIVNEGAKAERLAMEESAEVNQDTLNRPLAELNATDAEQVTREWNKVKNFFTTEFGPEIVKALRSVSLGGDAFIGILRTLTEHWPQMVGRIGGGGGGLDAVAGADHVRLDGPEGGRRITVGSRRSAKSGDGRDRPGERGRGDPGDLGQQDVPPRRCRSDGVHDLSDRRHDCARREVCLRAVHPGRVRGTARRFRQGTGGPQAEGRGRSPSWRRPRTRPSFRRCASPRWRAAGNTSTARRWSSGPLASRRT